MDVVDCYFHVAEPGILATKNALMKRVPKLVPNKIVKEQRTKDPIPWIMQLHLLYSQNQWYLSGRRRKDEIHSNTNVK